MSSGPSPEQRQAVVDRAGGRCECCRGWGEQVHHRRPRGAGGTSVSWINDPANLLLLCATCHRWVESHRREAYELGLLVSYSDEPWAVPARLWFGRVWLGVGYQTEQREAS